VPLFGSEVDCRVGYVVAEEVGAEDFALSSAPPETRGSRLLFSVCPFQVDYHLCRCSWESHLLDWFRRFCEPNPDPCISSCIRLRLQLWLWTLHWWPRERWWWGKCMCVPLHPLSFVPCDCLLGWPTSPAWLSLGWNLPDDIFSLGELLPPGWLPLNDSSTAAVMVSCRSLDCHCALVSMA
jgi:hypothetical protein